ncbi:hypothetical protein BDZ97DRAFT_1783876 [Flammula alnicola]|nr:hypothetical protein BDZ97DRAFT_1783876 [Flammula alnicola]
MNPRCALTKCVDAKDADGMSTECIVTTKALQHQTRHGGFSTLSSQHDDFSSFAEASASPAKYAIFQVLGFKFIQATGQFDIPLCLSGSFGSSAKVGAFGGAVLTLLYLGLLLRRRHLPQEDGSSFSSFSSFVLVLGKEIVYSVLAAIIGASIAGRNSHHELFCFTLAGVLGPIIALMIMVGILALIIGAVWSTGKFKNWCSGY